MTDEPSERQRTHIVPALTAGSGPEPERTLLSLAQLRPTLARLLRAIRAHFAEAGCPPSLSDLSRATRMTRQRVSKLLPELEAAGAILHTPGQAHSIRLPDLLGHFSDDELLRDHAQIVDELVRRGHGAATARVGVVLREAYQIEDGLGGFGDMLGQIDEAGS